MQTVILCMTTLALNFALYGSGYAMPQVLTQILPTANFSMAPASVLLIGLALVSILLLVTMFRGTWLSPKAGLALCLVASAASALLFCWTTDATEPSSLVKRLLLILASFGLFGGPTFGFLFVVQLSSLLYPTLTSATGIAVCLGVGRLGAIAAPLFFGAVQEVAGAWKPFFITMALLELGCLIVLMPLSIHSMEPLDASQFSRGKADAP